jgi:hypothetical protein
MMVKMPVLMSSIDNSRTLNNAKRNGTLNRNRFVSNCLQAWDIFPPRKPRFQTTKACKPKRHTSQNPFENRLCDSYKDSNNESAAIS